MANSTWFELSVAEVAIIAEALSALRSAAPARADEIDRLAMNLIAAAPPAITVGVYGGVVQWVRGNPYSIRIIDYDGDDDDLLDEDDDGLPCSLWLVERDPDLGPAQARSDRSR